MSLRSARHLLRCKVPLLRASRPCRLANRVRASARRRIHSLIDFHHDVAGLLDGKIDRTDRPIMMWEREMDALLSLLVSKNYITVDELRRGIEGLPAEHQKSLKYYEKWAVSMAMILLERNVLSHDDLLPPMEDIDQKAQTFDIGDFVVVKTETGHLPWPKPHLRTPGYVHGVIGEVVASCGKFKNPELLAYRRQTREEALYRVKFRQKDLWEHYTGGESDSTVVEIYAPWLQRSEAPPTSNPSPSERFERIVSLQRQQEEQKLASHSHSHSHGDHGHHDHGTRGETEQNAVDLEGAETPGMMLARELKAAVMTKGVITPKELRAGVEKLEMLGQQSEGPRIVARAWTDPAFKELLVTDASAAAGELGIMAQNSTASTVLTVVENTPETHNLVVCTLCSCYPRSILGLSPTWYRSRNYRSRAVREPRAVLKEFGLELPESTQIQVHDSTADLRYMVLPTRPPGTDHLGEAELAKLVTRDSMIGVANPLPPQ